MNDATDSTTVALTGQPTFVLLLAAALALPASIGLLKLYRRAVLRSMRTRANSRATGPVPLEAFAPPNQPMQTAPDLSVLDHASPVTAVPATEGLHSNLLRAPWRAAAVYMGAGFCYALVLTTTFLAATGSELLPLRFLLLFWIYAYPVVLTINLVAAATRRAKLGTASVYFLVLAALGAFGIARSPTLSWDQIAVLWLFTNLPATVLLLAFLNRRVRAVGPLVLTFMILAIMGSTLALSVVESDERLFNFIFELGWALGLGTQGIFIGLIILDFAVFGVAGWSTLR